MSPNEIGKHCSSCNTSVYHIADKSLEEINDLKMKNDDKICGRISKVQYEQFRFLHPLKRFAIALFLVFGTGLFTTSYGQIVKESGGNERPNYTSNIHFTAKDNDGKPLANVDVSYQIGDAFIQGQTDSLGRLELRSYLTSGSAHIGFNIYYRSTYAYIEKHVSYGESRFETIIYNKETGEMTIGEHKFHEEFLLGDVMPEDWED